jgi:nucleotide-binding universal stress UspA family protein
MLSRLDALTTPEVERDRRGRVVLAAVDVGGPRERSRSVLEVASVLGGDRLHVVYSWTLVGWSVLACRIRGVSPERMRTLVSAIGRRHRERVLELCGEVLATNPAGIIVRRGDARAVVPAAARRVRADLVVLGGPWDGGLRHRFLGSVARAVVDRVSCDVLTVRGRYPW